MVERSRGLEVREKSYASEAWQNDHPKIHTHTHTHGWTDTASDTSDTLLAGAEGERPQQTVL